MRRTIEAICLLCGGLAVLAMMAVAVTDAAARALGAPFLGGKEISEALLVVSVGAALPLSVLGGKALAIEGLVRALPRRLGLGFTLAGLLLSVACLGGLSAALYRAGFDARDFAETSALLEIPYFYLYLYLAVFGALTALAFALLVAGGDADARVESP